MTRKSKIICFKARKVNKVTKLTLKMMYSKKILANLQNKSLIILFKANVMACLKIKMN
jgi:hypothetical protein